MECDDLTSQQSYECSMHMSQVKGEVIAQPCASRQPEFLKTMIVIKELGTNYFKGRRSAFAADSSLKNLEKSFSVTRCPEEYKKDIAIHYLKKDAANWWTNLEKQFEDKEPTWEDFRREFEKKYFPQEVKDKLEAKFLELKQAERNVRKYVSYDNEAAIIQRFIRGLRPDIRSSCLLKFTVVSRKGS